MRNLLAPLPTETHGRACLYFCDPNFCVVDIEEDEAVKKAMDDHMGSANAEQIKAKKSGARNPVSESNSS